MKLQTQIPFSSEGNQIDYHSRTLLLGSCFTEHIGGKLEYFKFQQLQNPFGIIFHPVALERLIARAIEKQKFTSEDIFEQNGNWHCREVHSLLTHVEAEDYLDLLNATLDSLSTYIESTTHLLITFGTAWGYRFTESGEIVANCHKIPQNRFSKELLSVSEVTETCEKICESIHDVNPACEIVFTVSPVRHLKDGYVENMRSKAHLIAGIHQYLTSCQGPVRYFPSYELMMDELRDYRFYAEDMLHPNSTAVEVIWERFSRVWIDPSTSEVQKEIAGIQAGLAHRPFHPESQENKEFQEQLQKRIAAITTRFPHIRF